MWIIHGHQQDDKVLMVL